MIREHLVRDEEARRVRFHVRLEDTNRLAEKGVPAAAPGENGTLPHVEQRRSATFAPPRRERDLLADAARVREPVARNVASGARNLSDLALEPERAGRAVVVAVEELPREPGIEKQALPEDRRPLVVGVLVDRIRPGGREHGRRQLLEHLGTFRHGWRRIASTAGTRSEDEHHARKDPAYHPCITKHRRPPVK